MEEYGYDNSAFIQELEDLGFYVAKCSQSNYHKTIISIPSTLNMNYEENFWPGGDYKDDAMAEYFHHSLVRQELSKQGYKTISIESGSYFSEIPDADVYLARKDDLPWFEGVLEYAKRHLQWDPIIDRLEEIYAAG